MIQSKELIHSPISDQADNCLACGHACHCGGTCNSKSCHCGKCVHDPAELSDEE